MDSDKPGVTAASVLAAARCTVASCISSSPPEVYEGSLQHFKFWFPHNEKEADWGANIKTDLKMFYKRSGQDG